MENRILAKQFKNAIVSDLSCLNGTQFEDLCKAIFSLVLNREVLHKGCNLNGKPVPYAVDVKTEDCKIVGQSGTDVDYFTKSDFVKPMKDIEGTKNNNPLCETLYLFSNQRDSDSQHTGLVKKINETIPPFTVEIYDAEKIAETIYDKIDNPKCGDVWQYLSKSYQFYAIMPKRNCIPQPAPNYILRSLESEELISILEHQSIVEVYGVSGIGKSEFAKQIAKDISQEFDTILWIKGNEFDTLDSVRLCQFGYEVNLRFILENYKSLVIIDNLNETVNDFSDDFLKSNKHDSKCIITTIKRHISNAYAYQLPYMKEETASELINRFQIDIQEDDKYRLMQITSGYPLAINMICSLVAGGEFTMAELLEDGALYEIEDDRSQRLPQRIIGKIYEKYVEELNIIAYIDSQIIQSEYLHETCNRIHLKYLVKYSIIQPDDAYTFRIHQVVLEAIKYLAQAPDINKTSDNLTSYLDKKNKLKDVQFFSLFHYNNSFVSKVYDIANVEQKKVILYSKLQAEDTFSNPSMYLELISQLLLNPATSLYDCLLLLDKNEINLFTIPREEQSDKAKVIVEELNSILEQTDDIEIKFEILHHRGKLYAKINEKEQALTSFEEALCIHPKAYPTLFQLAKLKHFCESSEKEQVKDIVSVIMNDYYEGKEVSLTIVLTCYSTFIAKKGYSDLAEKYVEDEFDFFSKVIMTSLMSFNSQTVPTLGSFAFSLAYKNPDFVRMALKIVQEPPSRKLGKSSIQGYAFLKAVEYKLEENKQTQRAFSILESAKTYFNLLELEKNEGKFSKDYIRKRYLELLIDASQYDEAISFSECFDDKDSEFYHQDMAKLYHSMKVFDKALLHIDKAISNTHDKGYQSSYMWNKANILHDMKDPSCITLLHDAINMREKDKAREDWMSTLSMWKDE